MFTWLEGFFIVCTDHDSLKGMKQLAKLTGQMARWIDFLEGFQFEVKTRPGKEHDNADFLSTPTAFASTENTSRLQKLLQRR